MVGKFGSMGDLSTLILVLASCWTGKESKNEFITCFHESWVYEFLISIGNFYLMQKNKTRKISWKKIGDSEIVKTCDELDQKAIPLWSLPMPLQHLLREFWFLHHVIADSIWKRKRNEEKLIKVLIIFTKYNSNKNLTCNKLLKSIHFVSACAYA